MPFAPHFAVPAAFSALLALFPLPMFVSAANQTSDGHTAAPGSTSPLNSADVATFNAVVANTRANLPPSIRPHIASDTPLP